MKRIPIPLAMLLLAVLACSNSGLGQNGPATSAVSTLTSMLSLNATTLPTQTPIPTTLTPSPLSTPIPLALVGTPYFQPAEAISTGNAGRVTTLARWGNGKIYAIALSPNGQTLAAATTIGVSLYSADSLELQATWLTSEEVEALAFSPDGQTLATGSGSTLQLWNLDSGMVRIDLMKGDVYLDSIVSMAFSPDGKYLAAGTHTGIRIFDLRAEQQVAAFSDPEEYLNITWALAFSPDGSMLASAQSHAVNTGGLIMLWDTGTWQLQQRFEQDGVVGGPEGLAFSSDGRKLVFTSSWYYNWVWDLESGTSLKAEAADAGTHYDAVAISPDGNTLAGGSYYGILDLWDAHTGGNRRNLQAEGYPLRGLIFSQDGTQLYAASTEGIRLWDLNSQSVTDNVIDHLVTGTVISISPDGRQLATLAGEEVIFWDITNGTQMRTVPGEYYAAISPDWSLLAAVVPDDPQTLVLYDLMSGAELHRMYQGERQAVHEMFFSPDGRVLAQLEYANEGRLLLWDTRSGILLYSLPEAYSFLAFSPNGQSFAALDTQEDAPEENPIRVSLQFWDVASGTRTESLPLGQRIIDAGIYTADSDAVINTLAFSPDGSRMAVGINNLISLWDRASGMLLWVTEEHDYLGDLYLAFSPDGSVLAVGNKIGNPLVLLNATTGELLAPLVGHTSYIDGLVVSPDGKLLVSSGIYDGTVRIWGVMP